MRIIGESSVKSCCILLLSAYDCVFVYDRYSKSILVYVLLSDLDLSRHHLHLRGTPGPNGRLVQNSKLFPHCCV